MSPLTTRPTLPESSARDPMNFRSRSTLIEDLRACLYPHVQVRNHIERVEILDVHRWLQRIASGARGPGA